MKTIANSGKIRMDIDLGDLPNGEYPGTWSGYKVCFFIDNHSLELDVKDGIRGKADCIVTISGDAQNTIIGVKTLD